MTAYEGLEKIVSHNLTKHINQPNIDIYIKDMISPNFKIYIVRDGYVSSCLTHHNIMWSTILMESEFKHQHNNNTHKAEDHEIMNSIINYLLD